MSSPLIHRYCRLIFAASGWWIVPALMAAELGLMLDLQPTADQEMLVSWSAPAGDSHEIQISTNLLDWQPLWTLTSQGQNQRADSAAPYRAERFYRAVSVSNMELVTGDHLSAGVNPLILHPINHATFVLRWGSRMIYIDPVGGSAPFAGLPRADLILVCHAHGDHYNSSTIEAVRKSDTVIIAPQAVYNAMSTAQRSLTTILANGSQTSALGAAIQAVPAYNLTSSYHPQGVGNGYVLTLDGVRVYVSGDTEDVPEMRALGGIDVAVLCMNLPYTMNVTQAASAARAFRPMVVYPYHYRNQDNSYADLAQFKRLVGQDLGIEVRLRNWY